MSREQSDRAFRLGVGAHQAGKLSEAEAHYRRALGLHANHADAMQLLGVVLSQTGRAAEGIELLKRAIALVPRASAFQANLGLALAGAGRKDEAIAAFHQAVALEPGNPQHRMNLASALREAGQFDAALGEYRQAVALQPPSFPLLMAYGAALQQAGRNSEAAACFRRAIDLQPGATDAHTSLGASLYFNNQRAEAETALRQSLALDPSQHVAWYFLGNVLQELRRLDEAVGAYQRALALHPNFPEALHNLGTTYRDGRKLEEALANYRAVLALGYDSFELRSNLGVASKDMGDLDEAVNWFEKALELRADPVVESNLVYTLHFHPQSTPQSLAKAHAQWNQRYARPLLPPTVSFLNDPNPNRGSTGLAAGRLRVGYVSPDFRIHPVGIFLGPLLGLHDHEKFEVVCYSDVRAPDAFTERFRSYANVWRDSTQLTDAQLADRIREDRIDILVDLTMHMSGSRLLTFARKPAPVQVTYLAYCSTTGLEAMDYRLSDPYLDPPGIDESVYSEKTVRLPRTYWCYRAALDAPQVNPPPAQSTGYVTFGCLNNYSKVTAAALETWFEILRRVPGSRLIIHADAGSHRARAQTMIAAAGLDPARLEFTGFAPYADYLKLHHRIDIVLDPSPYTGGTTSCDAIWMGVPAITLKGQTAVSRGGFSILSNLGLTDLVASNRDQYIDLATTLAADLPRLAQLRSTLRDRMRNSPLCDAPQFTRDVESAYRAMWRQWCAR